MILRRRDRLLRPSSSRNSVPAERSLPRPQKNRMLLVSGRFGAEGGLKRKPNSWFLGKPHGKPMGTHSLDRPLGLSLSRIEPGVGDHSLFKRATKTSWSCSKWVNLKFRESVSQSRRRFFLEAKQGNHSATPFCFAELGPERIRRIPESRPKSLFWNRTLKASWKTLHFQTVQRFALGPKQKSASPSAGQRAPVGKSAQGLLHQRRDLSLPWPQRLAVALDVAKANQSDGTGTKFGSAAFGAQKVTP